MRMRLFPIILLITLASCGGGSGNSTPAPQIDADLDGLWDADEFFPNDTDNDGLINAADADDDNDGVADADDAFPFDPTESLDTDTDGVGNRADTDEDNDTVLDTDDALPLVAGESRDADGDTLGDNADADDDNDGYADAIDLAPYDATAAGDLDGDGIDSMTDSDDDDDQYADALEVTEGSDPFDATSTPLDTDADLLTDAQEAAWTSDASLADTDGDGVRDDIEFAAQTDPRAHDTDSDGLDDAAESFTDDFDGDGRIDVRDAYRAWPFRSATAAATDSEHARFGLDADADRVCTADYTADAVRIYTRAGLLLQTLTGLHAPNDCALLPDGRVLVADTGNDRIVVFSANGSIVATHAHQSDGTPGGFVHPRAISIDTAGNWYVADTWSNRVQRYVAVTAQWSVVAPTLALRDPQDVAANAAGDIAIADTGNQRVLVLNSAQQLVLVITAASLDLPPLMLLPRSVAFGDNATLYVVDAAASRVLVVSTVDGRLLRQFGTAGDAANELREPSAIAVDGAGRVVVTDRTRMQEW